VKALLAGRGAAEALGSRGEGRVLASFEKACYLDVPAGLVALVAPGVPSGPVHVILDVCPPRWEPGAVAQVGPDGINVGGDRIDCSEMRSWWGELPPPRIVREAGPLIETALDEVVGGNLVPAPRAAACREHLARGDLSGVVADLAGAGPGLTPAGDDALAGILFARAALGGGVDLVSIARTARTTTLSSAFLLWAARGQALAPAHDLLLAAGRGDAGAARSAAASLGAVGHSSGADFAWGLLQGLRGVRGE
jgi:hypothetical protein